MKVQCSHPWGGGVPSGAYLSFDAGEVKEVPDADGEWLISQHCYGAFVAVADDEPKPAKGGKKKDAGE